MIAKVNHPDDHPASVAYPFFESKMEQHWNDSTMASSEARLKLFDSSFAIPESRSRATRRDLGSLRAVEAATMARRRWTVGSSTVCVAMQLGRSDIADPFEASEIETGRWLECVERLRS